MGIRVILAFNFLIFATFCHFFTKTPALSHTHYQSSKRRNVHHRYRCKDQEIVSGVPLANSHFKDSPEYGEH